jgi:hypothetical protein
MIVLASGLLQLATAQDFAFEQNLDGLVVMEAENYSANLPNGTAEWQPVDEPADFSGSGGMLVVADAAFASAEDALTGAGVLVYRINFTKTGIHYIWARASRDAANPGGSDSFHAGLDGSIPESGTMIIFEDALGGDGDGTWQWIWKCNTIGGQAYVEVSSAGVHEFAVYMREKNFRIDKIVLTPMEYADGAGYGPPEDSIPETLAATGIPPHGQDREILSLYPNPVKDRVRVRIAGGELQVSRIGIFDMAGRRVESLKVEYCGTVEVDLSGLASGVYQLRLGQEDGTRSVRPLVKL